MTVSNTERSVSYVGTGGLTRFAVPFQFFELSVHKDDVLVDPSEYTIEQTDTGLTGTVVFLTAPAGGEVVDIKGNTTVIQDTDYVNNDSFPADSHEKGLDRLTMAVQEVKRDFDKVYGITDWTANPDRVVTVDDRGVFVPSAYSTADLEFLFNIAGVDHVYATKAAMDAGAAALAANALVLVLVDESHGGLPTVWQKLSGTMTFIRTMPFAQLGNVVDAKTFGISGGSDETAEIEALRQYLIARGGHHTVVLPPVEIWCQTPKWFPGVENLTIVAVGTSFRNLGAGTYGGSDMDSAFYLGSGPYTHTMTRYSPVTGSGAPDATLVTDYGTGVTVNSGYLIDDVAIGATSFTCLTAAQAANFAVGAPVLLHWDSRQAGSFPMNPGAFEYHEVTAVDTGTGVVTVREAIQYPYKKQAPDDTTYTVSCGKARAIPLDRSDHKITKSVTLIGGKGVNTGVGTLGYRGALYIAGALDAVVVGAKFDSFFPTMAGRVTAEKCQFHDLLEIDKCVTDMVFVGSSLNKLTQGTGVINFKMYGGKLTGPSAQMLARNVLFDGVTVLSQGTGGDAKQIGRSSYPCRSFVVRNCTFYPDGSQTACVQPGNIEAFTPDAVSATTMTINTGNAAYGDVRAYSDVGQHVILNLSGSGQNNEIFTITDKSYDASNNLVLTGWHTVQTPTAASTQRILYLTEMARVDHESNRVVNRPAKCELHDRSVRAWDSADTDGSRRTTTFLLKHGDYSNYTVNGWLKRIDVDVLKPYFGSDASATLAINKDGPGTTSWGGETINVKQGGTRIIEVGRTVGAAAGDTLANITQNMFVKDIILHLSGSGGTGVFSDADDADLPLVRVTVETAHLVS